MSRSSRFAVVLAAIAPLLGGVLPAHAAADDFYTVIDIPSRNPQAEVGVPFLVTGHVRGSWTTPITRVEVTTDDGRTWHPAEGTTEWRYAFTPTGPGVHVTGARAYNDTGVSPVSAPDIDVHVGLTGPLPFAGCLCILDSFAWRGGYDPDPEPVEVGTRIRFDRPGEVTGVYLKRGDYRGPVVVHLWRGDGTLLAEQTGGSDPSSWQIVGFDQAVPVQPGVDYVASYYTPEGGYRSTEHYYTGTVVSAPFIAPHNGVSGAGVYRYGVGGGFPTESWHDSNYWVSPTFYE
ncbi:DUF4082 domain-containing protein [Saccharothrix luteola]|uniref:DUF4082 domain-containing protein n=1 Tax=Saccharothrix luteola TaxID=2893018 RepID=UPI001E62A89A|nr:DUF4082 domain-containing protein [Saccharothrix luteola]MCC8249990.1 DUF4082 domain-containing protein [Saccharothrix luteola]